MPILSDTTKLVWRFFATASEIVARCLRKQRRLMMRIAIGHEHLRSKRTPYQLQLRSSSSGVVTDRQYFRRHVPGC